jgi:hypothetical protein
MPFPFKIHYGKIGKIFIKVPFTSINSSPLQIEISDIFLFVRPKEMELWKKEVEIEAFIKANLASLEKFETYL